MSSCSRSANRTGTDYSFAERSNGLKYFLSYHVQLLAHKPRRTGNPEILLMDEPDAFLSSQGQQDLLRILEEFASPEDQSRQDQVVYVTHSPFLINRNAAERIRVLDKGASEEGTRVVKDAARNHYEPLRSSLGTFVAETSFIGGLNLFVEGLADQVLLAGVSAHLIARGAPKTDTLDLNTVTIVPAGSASSVPYLVYLARGRDIIRPPCVVLLDSDSAGDDAANTLARGGPRRKQILSADFVIRLGPWADANVARLSISDGVIVKELEDLIPVTAAVRAAKAYATNIIGMSPETAELLVSEDVNAQIPVHSGSLFDALKSAFTERFRDEAHIEKVGFAKELVATLIAGQSTESEFADLRDFQDNIGTLLAEIARLLRRANQLEVDRRLNDRLKRAVTGFLSDYPAPTTRERGRLLVEEIQSTTEDSDRGDAIRLQLEKLVRDFGLDESLTEPIAEFGTFRERVEALQYVERFMLQNATAPSFLPPEAAPPQAAPPQAVPPQAVPPQTPTAEGQTS